MPIEVLESGSTIITGKSIEAYRLYALAAALRLEARGLSIRRGVNVRKLVQAELGTKERDYQVLHDLITKKADAIKKADAVPPVK